MKQLKQILGCLVFVFLIGALSACSFGPKPEEVAKEFLDATIAMDLQKQNQFLQTQLTEDQLTQSEQDFKDLFNGDDEYAQKLGEKMKASYKSAKYEIKNTETKGDRSTVTVEITSKAVFQSMMMGVQEYITTLMTRATTDPKIAEMSEDEITKEMFNTISKSIDEAQETKQTVEIELTKIDKEWKIANNSAEAIVYACMGTSASELDRLQKTSDSWSQP